MNKYLTSVHTTKKCYFSYVNTLGNYKSANIFILLYINLNRTEKNVFFFF